MILVDERVGSREHLQALRNLGVDAELGGRLAGDFQFEGHGADGQVLVGVERKTIADLASSMRQRRLVGQQLRPFVEAYDEPLLVVEGIWRRQRESGYVEVPGGRGWMPLYGKYYYAEILSFLESLQVIAGLRVARTGDSEETAAWLVTLYRWWQKPWQDHRSMQAVYAPEPEVRRNGHRALGLPRKATLAEKWAAQLGGIDDRAVEVAGRFESAKQLANADVDEWLERTKGLRIGRKTAEKIVGEICQ